MIVYGGAFDVVPKGAGCRGAFHVFRVSEQVGVVHCSGSWPKVARRGSPRYDLCARAAPRKLHRVMNAEGARIVGRLDEASITCVEAF